MASVWMDGKPHVATDKDVAGRWGGAVGFGCALCGVRFKAGDTYRWVYMNGASPSPGNFFVCPSCDVLGLADKVRSALSRHKPHMDEWVLLYMLQEHASQAFLRGLERAAEVCKQLAERVSERYDARYCEAAIRAEAERQAGKE